MNIKYILSIMILLTLQVAIDELTYAETIYFETDFEDGNVPIDKPNPIWSISATLNDLYGPGNNFEISNSSAHSGTYSLKFDYEGRNGFCNTCGYNSVITKNDLDGASYFLSDTGEDLSQDPYYAEPGRIIFNITNGFSKWQIISVDSQDETNDKLTLKLLAPGINGEKAEFKGGDKALITRQCGVDGLVGHDIDRRNDCDKVITYFNDVSGTQLPGQSIFRRMYIRSNVINPATYQKLRYWTLGKTHIVLLASDKKGDIVPKLAGLNVFGGKNVYTPGLNMIDGISFAPGIWYYVEEEFKAESYAGAGDGHYRLWFSKSGEETNTPLIEELNLALPPVTKTTLWGNIQHWTDVRGYWYIDDIKISDTRVGPVSETAIKHAPPSATQTNVN